MYNKDLCGGRASLPVLPGQVLFAQGPVLVYNEHKVEQHGPGVRLLSTMNSCGEPAQPSWEAMVAALQAPGPLELFVEPPPAIEIKIIPLEQLPEYNHGEAHFTDARAWRRLALLRWRACRPACATP